MEQEAGASWRQKIAPSQRGLQFCFASWGCVHAWSSKDRLQTGTPPAIGVILSFLEGWSRAGETFRKGESGGHCGCGLRRQYCRLQQDRSRSREQTDRKEGGKQRLHFGVVDQVQPALLLFVEQFSRRFDKSPLNRILVLSMAFLPFRALRVGVFARNSAGLV